MDAKRFNEVFEEVVEASSNVLVAKALEYADDTDRLRNFKQAAHLKEESPREALAGMMAKHTVSVYDLLLGENTPSLAQWDEKMLDHINYLILARGLIIEEIEGES